MKSKKNNYLVILIFSLIAFSACKSKKPGGGGEPTPTPAPTATPTPTPTPPQDCFETIPDNPVAPRKNGSCPALFEKATIGASLPVGDPRRTDVCVAKSSCLRPNSNDGCDIDDYPEITYQCGAMKASLEWGSRYGCSDGGGGSNCDATMPNGYFYDYMRGIYDAFGRVYAWNVSPPSASTYKHSWNWAGYCPPKICPDKSIGTKCTNPVPPPVDHFQITVVGQLGNGQQIIEATPIVCDGPAGSPTAGYCSRAWNGNKQGCCPVRPSSDPQMKTCRDEVVGLDRANNRHGPTFYELDPNQGGAQLAKFTDDYQAVIYKPGHVRVCTGRTPKACSEGDF